MEEECCHGNAMGQLNGEENSQMLGGDKSLNNYLNAVNEKREQILTRSNFQENKSKIETFYKPNIEMMLENNNKLIDAKEKYKLKRLEYLGNKELYFEMDPFTWELVRCRDGTTKIKIIEEDDEHKEWGKEEVIDEEDIFKIRSYENTQYEVDDEEDFYVVPITFEG
jgi:hypothetical protein